MQEGGQCTAAHWGPSGDNGPQAGTGIQLLIPFSWWEMAWKCAPLELQHPEESPWVPKK